MRLPAYIAWALVLLGMGCVDFKCTGGWQQRQPAISGRVVDASTGKPIEGAEVKYSSKFGSAQGGTLTTDHDGVFKQDSRRHFYFTRGLAEPAPKQLFAGRIIATEYLPADFHFEWGPLTSGAAWNGTVALERVRVVTIVRALEEDAPATAPTTRPADEVVAEWRFIDGERLRDRNVIDDRRIIVRIYGDGRVELSPDLMLGGGQIREGKLSAEELERLEKALSRILHGVEGKEVSFGHASRVPWHELEVKHRNGQRTLLSSAMRYMELEQASAAVIWSGTRDGNTWVDLGKGWQRGTRFEAMQKGSQPYMAHRAIWIELEAEILRAAAQSLLPDQARLLPKQRFHH